MMNKIVTAIIAVLMIATAGIVLVDSEESQATSTTSGGAVNVYYYGTDGWASTEVQAFDLYQALVNAQNTLGYSITYADGADSWNKLVGSGDYAYYDINENYGKIAAVDGSSSFSVYVYNNSTAQWVSATDAVGLYRPFADYASIVETSAGSSAGAANIAIASGSVSTISLTGMIGLTTVDADSYRYSFTLRDSTGTVSVPAGVSVTYKNLRGAYVTKELASSDLASGITIYGNGSDAYLALVDALGIVSGSYVVNGQNITVKDNGGYYTYYSWIDTILGAGTSYDASTGAYSYWASYDSAGGYLNYTLGYYSSISGAPNAGSAFSLTYV